MICTDVPWIAVNSVVYSLRKVPDPSMTSQPEKCAPPPPSRPPWTVLWLGEVGGGGQWFKISHIQ
jgi:hypothetical protein